MNEKERNKKKLQVMPIKALAKKKKKVFFVVVALNRIKIFIIV